jgi:hypothetical protein
MRLLSGKSISSYKFQIQLTFAIIPQAMLAKKRLIYFADKGVS